MRISYFYNIPLPSQTAASIQILNTCRAMAGRGAEVTVFCARMLRATSTQCLAFYGLPYHENLRISYGSPLGTLSFLPLFAAGSWKGLLFRGLLEKTLADRSAGVERHFVISRDDAGIRLFDQLRRVPPAPNERRVFEAHRLARLYEEEKLRRRYGDSLPAKARRAIERLKEAEKRTVGSADGIICLTAGVRDALATLFSITCPTLILPSGASVANPAPRAASQDIDVIYVGKLQRRKGVGLLIQAMEHLPDRNLTIVGGEPEDVAKHREAVREKGLQNRITLTGFVAPPEVSGFLARARVGVCPLPAEASSIAERFTSPLKILEMMAAGVPIVASDLPSTREILEHEKTALLVPPNDAEALAAAIRRLLSDPALARRLAEEANLKVQEYSWDNRARKLMEFLEALP
ncbi:MAG: glycosyltransferase family 4 protein [Candidatus Sumerlaeota bacterium]|nr:glycosyltransferase family 4 protein [Candidatus Sumerlaeota bacterium]